MSSGRISRPDFWAILLLVGASFLYFSGAFWPQDGRLLFGYDVFRMFYPFGEFAGEAFRAGKLPLWNPTVFLGFPQYAEPQLSTFYPLSWPLAWLPATFAFPWQYALHFAWTAVGGYVLVRQLGGKWSGALLTGFTLTFALTMTVRPFVGHLPHVMTLSWVPWCLAAALWATRKQTWSAAVIAAIPLGLAFLVGYIPYLILLIPALTLFLLWLAWLAWRENDRRRALFIGGQLLVIGLVAVLLAAVQFLPAGEFALYSNRTSGRYDYADNESIPFSYLITTLMPDIYGALQGDIPLWVSNFSIDFYSEWALYVGILPLLLLILSWFVVQRQDRFWILLAFLGLLMAFGDKGVLSRILYDHVPGMNAFRFVSRPVYFFTLGAAVTAGLAFDRWFDQTTSRHTELARYLKVGLGLVLGLGLIALAVASALSLVATEAEQAAIVLGFGRQLVRALLLIGGALALLIWGYGRPRWLLLALALIFLTVDLWGQGQKFLTYVRGEPYPEWQTVDEYLPGDRDNYRVLTKVLAENGGYFYGLNSIYGYDGFTLEASETFNDLSVTDARIVRLLSGRFLIHGPGWDLPVIAPGWEAVARPDEMTIYERTDSGPRAFIVYEVLAAANADEALQLLQQPELDLTRTAVVEIVPDTHCAITPGDPVDDRVHLVEHRGDEVVLQVETQETGWLVLNELYYPGWQATVDGNPATVQPTNYALRGVCVPAGNHEVVFNFRPAVLRYGAWTSLFALSLVGLAIIWQFRPGSRERQ